MTTDTLTVTPTQRTAKHQHYLMCRPEHFDVTYTINPWMDPTAPVDAALALRQWEILRETYLSLGHTVDLINPVEGLPDMVFAANGGIVLDGRAMASRFTHDERAAEGQLYLDWFAAAGLTPAVQATEQNEGEGDVLRIGDIFLAGTGFRTSLAAHREIATFFSTEVVSLELVDPRFYHLDTALTVLDDENVAYFPGAFSDASLEILRARFPDAVIATADDARVFGLNAMSDGYNVVLSARAVDLHRELRARGYNPVGVDLTELLKAGGSAKCCTLEIRA
ncbi:dimethylargininase [Aeromicrobium sp. UC242_57]|uniref:dimethylargininase n=1 Tax=Aeromicrobium sp. UC242_57 TaxID=3374624 RepID=UPI00379643DC